MVYQNHLSLGLILELLFEGIACSNACLNDSIRPWDKLPILEGLDVVRIPLESQRYLST